MPEPEQEYEVVLSKRAAQMLTAQAAYLAQLDKQLAHRLVKDFREAADSLRHFPYRSPRLYANLIPAEKYRKLIFDKRYLILYQILDRKVYIEYVIDGKQDYEWLLE